jgi:hypothetical protein
MKFVKQQPMNAKAVFGIGFSGQYLIETSCRQIDDAFLTLDDLASSVKSGTHSHHISRHVKDDGSLLPIGSAAVNFCSFFAIAASQ